MAEEVSRPGYLSVATTGILGPDTDDHQVPIGIVYFFGGCLLFKAF